MGDILSAAMRWIHLASVITLLGGIVFWRFVMDPSTKKITPEDYRELEEGAASHFRPLVYLVMVTLVLSGLYNYLAKPGHTRLYEILFGIKMLLVLHIFAAAILASRPGNARRSRQLTGIVISGIVVLIISAAFRWV